MSQSNGHVIPDGEVRAKPVEVDRVPVGLQPIDTTLVYAPYLSAGLRGKVERFRRVGVSLLEELAVVRAVASDAAVMYDKSLQAAENLIGDNLETKRMQIQAAAASYLYAALGQVRDMSMAAHRVMHHESIDPQIVQAILFQAVKQMDNELQRESLRLESAGIDPQALTNRISQAIDEHVGLGLNGEGQQFLGTTLTPEDAQEQLDLEVQSMDDTIPEMKTG